MKYLMRKWRNDFQNNNDSYYDLIDDFDLIESSFAEQYGIRLRSQINSMKWGEFSSLLSGINQKTVLGNVVRIRSEKDPKIIQNFNENERKIRSEWLRKNAKNVIYENYEQTIENIKNMFKSMASNKKK